MPGIDELSKFNIQSGFSPFALFKKLISEGKIRFNFGLVSVDLKDDDLQRVHDIIYAIDDRRAFYNAYGDEVPKYVVESVRETKKEVYGISKGLWSNLWAREVVQHLLHELGSFLTKVERSIPNFQDEGFPAFIEQLVELRLKVWTVIAHFVVVFGEVVKPIHLPVEIEQEIRLAYK
jgi:hypothetical protein